MYHDDYDDWDGATRSPARSGPANSTRRTSVTLPVDSPESTPTVALSGRATVVYAAGRGLAGGSGLTCSPHRQHHARPARWALTGAKPDTGPPHSEHNGRSVAIVISSSHVRTLAFLRAEEPSDEEPAEQGPDFACWYCGTRFYTSAGLNAVGLCGKCERDGRQAEL